MNLSAYALDTVMNKFHQDIELPSKAYPHDISGSHMQRTSGVQQQSTWPVKQNISSYHQLNQQISETDRANPFERRAPPPTPRAAMGAWSDRPSTITSDLANTWLGTPT